MTIEPGSPAMVAGARRSVYSGKVFEVFHLDKVRKSGAVSVFEHAERSPGVRIIVTDGEGVMLTKEEREELQGWDYRLPGGKVFDRFLDYAAVRDDGEAIRRAARAAAARELAEEALVKVNEADLMPVRVSIAGATVIWDLHYFVVRVAEPIASTEPIETEEGERVGREWVSREQAFELFCRGQMREERSAAILMQLILGGGEGFAPPPELNWKTTKDHAKDHKGGDAR